MRAGINLTTWEDWTIGASFYVAEDEHGMCRILELGFLFFVIELGFYSDKIDRYNPQ